VNEKNITFLPRSCRINTYTLRIQLYYPVFSLPDS